MRATGAQWTPKSSDKWVTGRFGLTSTVTPTAAGGRGAAEPGPLPWTVNEFLRTLTTNAVGMSGLLLAWFGVSGTADPETGMTYTVIGVGTLVMAGSANAVWLMRGRRACGARTAEVGAVLASALGTANLLAQVREPSGSSHDRRAVPTVLVTVPGTPRYHRPTCQLVVGKDVVSQELEAHVAAGLVPCGVCEA